MLHNNVDKITTFLYMVSFQNVLFMAQIWPDSEGLYIYVNTMWTHIKWTPKSCAFEYLFLANISSEIKLLHNMLELAPDQY